MDVVPRLIDIMLRREDGRYRNMLGRHPAACTCVNCVNKHLNRRSARRAGPPNLLGLLGKLTRLLRFR